MDIVELEEKGKGLDFSFLSNAKATELIAVDVDETIRQNPNPKDLPKPNFKLLVYNRESYDEFLFRPYAFGRLTAGQQKPLTEDQSNTLIAYTDRFNGTGKPLSSKQELTYHDLCIKKAKSKTVVLSPGAKTYLISLVREDRYGRSKRIATNILDKGLIMEDAAIEMYGKYIGQDLIKNTERVSNKYWIGECDNKQGIIRDFKVSWEYATFPIDDTEIKNTLYEWQLQCYMDLYKFSEAELVYCLVDTPLHMVDDLIMKLIWRHGLLNPSGDIEEAGIPVVVETVCNHIFTTEALFELCEQSSVLDIRWFADIFIEIPVEDRIKVLKTNRNEEMLRVGKEVCRLSREFMNSLIGIESKQLKELEEVVELKSKPKFTFKI